MVRIAWWVAAVGWMALLFWASSRSVGSLPPIPVNDKVIHLLVYATLAGLLVCALRSLPSSFPLATIAMIVILWVAVYGVSDEWHQSFVPGREVSVGDWLADVTGGALVVFATWWRSRRHAVPVKSDAP